MLRCCFSSQFCGFGRNKNLLQIVIKVLEPRLNNTARYQNLDVTDGHNISKLAVLAEHRAGERIPII